MQALVLRGKTTHSLPPVSLTALYPRLRGPRRSSNSDQARRKVIGWTSQSHLKSLQYPQTAKNPQLGPARYQVPQDNTCTMWPIIQGASIHQERKAKQQNEDRDRVGTKTKQPGKKEHQPWGKEGWGEEQRRAEGKVEGQSGEVCKAVVSQRPQHTQQLAHGRGCENSNILLLPIFALARPLPDTCEVAQKCAPA